MGLLYKNQIFDPYKLLQELLRPEIRLKAEALHKRPPAETVIVSSVVPGKAPVKKRGGRPRKLVRATA